MAASFFAIHRGGKVAAASVADGVGMAAMAHWRQRDRAKGTKREPHGLAHGSENWFLVGWFLLCFPPDVEDESDEDDCDDYNEIPAFAFYVTKQVIFDIFSFSSVSILLLWQFPVTGIVLKADGCL